VSRRRSKASRTLSGLALAAVLVFFLFPFVWMVQASLKTQIDITRIPPTWWFRPTLDNYVGVFRGQNFLRFMWNSFVIATASTLGSLALGLPAAYSIARHRQQLLAVTILAARIVPGITFLIPWFILFSQLHLVDTYWSLVLSHMVVGMPFIIWVMVAYYEALPGELEESARVDGCTRQGAFWHVILPLSAPGVLTSAILAFIFSWNNFMFSVVLAGDQRLLERFRCDELLPLGSRMRVRLSLERSTPQELQQCLQHALQKAGAPKLMTPELINTLCDHAQGNLRAMMNMAGELLALAAQREAHQIDEQLFFEAFAPNAPTQAKAAAGRRR